MEISVGPGGRIEFGGFSPVEAFRLASLLEQEGIVFYERLLDAFHDPEIRAAAEGLLASEKNHLDRFERELALEMEVLGDGAGEGEPEALLDSGIFPRPEEAEALFDALAGSRDLIALAVRIEEASIRFYQALLENTSRPGGRHAIEEVLDEERRHLAALRNLL
jgi:rubrerythrin